MRKINVFPFEDPEMENWIQWPETGATGQQSRNGEESHCRFERRSVFDTGFAEQRLVGSAIGLRLVIEYY